MPSGVRGPVDNPPCSRHLVLPVIGCSWQGAPDPVLARQSLVSFGSVLFVLVMALAAAPEFLNGFLKFGTQMEFQLIGRLTDIGRTSSVRNIFIALVFVDSTRLVEHCVNRGHLNLRDDEKRLSMRA